MAPSATKKKSHVTATRKVATPKSTAKARASLKAASIRAISSIVSSRHTLLAAASGPSITPSHQALSDEGPGASSYGGATDVSMSSGKMIDVDEVGWDDEGEDADGGDVDEDAVIGLEWNAPVYAFFQLRPAVETINGQCSHVFQCAAKSCLNKSHGVRHFLDKGDTRTEVLGADTVQAATLAKDADAVRAITICGVLHAGLITAMFKRKGNTITYSHKQHQQNDKGLTELILSLSLVSQANLKLKAQSIKSKPQVQAQSKILRPKPPRAETTENLPIATLGGHSCRLLFTGAGVMGRGATKESEVGHTVNPAASQARLVSQCGKHHRPMALGLPAVRVHRYGSHHHSTKAPGGREDAGVTSTSTHLTRSQAQNSALGLVGLSWLAPPPVRSPRGSACLVGDDAMATPTCVPPANESMRPLTLMAGGGIIIDNRKGRCRTGQQLSAGNETTTCMHAGRDDDYSRAMG
ncbi:hypothetical protein BD779DRAFT_1472007 [Infundibulicybe gibba]|nr:hypothetical protein BD779DRAFT_1472007 [Infundibulicybe gibba]